MGPFHAHRAMLVASYSPFKSMFQLGNDNEVIMAKDFTTEEILKDIKELYFVKNRRPILRCFNSIGKPVSTIEVVLTSQKPELQVLPIIKKQKFDEDFEELDDLEDLGDLEEHDEEFEELEELSDVEQETFVVKEKKKVARKKLQKPRSLDVSKGDSNRYINVPLDPVAYIQNSRTSTNEQPGCVHCALVFENREDLNLHVQKHMESSVSVNKRKIIRCEECIRRKVFHPSLGFQGYEKHLKVKHRKFKCIYCFQLSPDAEHDCIPSQHSCETCLKFIGTEEESEAHKQNWHSTINCKFCHKFFNDEKAKEMHETTCWRQVNPGAKGTHFKENHPDDVQGDTFNCLHCDAVTSTVQLLMSHMRIKHSEGNRCLICNVVLKKRTTYTTHARIHIKEEYLRFKCDFCDRRFPSQTKKTEHENHYHTGIKPLKCKYCDKHYAVSGSRAVHQRTCYYNPNKKTVEKRNMDKIGDGMAVQKLYENLQQVDFKPKKRTATRTNEKNNKKLHFDRMAPFQKNVGGDVNNQIMALLGNRK